MPEPPDHAHDPVAACHDALRLLARREYCRQEMGARLHARGYDPICIAGVLDRIAADGSLSEARFAQAFLHSRLRRGDTPRLAAMKARQRGVDEGVLLQALREIEAGFDSEAACRDMLRRRDPGGARFLDDRQWRRHARYLANKGFDAATVMRIMRER